MLPFTRPFVFFCMTQFYAQTQFIYLQQALLNNNLLYTSFPLYNFDMSHRSLYKGNDSIRRVHHPPRLLELSQPSELHYDQTTLITKVIMKKANC